MKLNLLTLEEPFRSRLRKAASTMRFLESKDGVSVYAKHAPSPAIERGNGSVTVYYNKVYEFFYGVKTFLSQPEVESRTEITCKFRDFGIMLDCSRNAVRTVETIKTFIDYMALMGYNQLQLYTEDTYEIEGEPYWGYQRGRYTAEEFVEIDAYARSYDIELVPCIQTLAHVNQALRWWEYKQIRDIDDILLIDDERTYELIDRMFATISKSFTSRKVHIGMDEAHSVGRGKYLDKHGYQNAFELMCKHLTKVVELAQKYGLEPMMWSDMFFRIAYDHSYYPPQGASGIPKEIIDKVPQSVRLVYWDYYNTDKSVYDGMIDRHADFENNDTVFAGGIWSWRGFAPGNRFSEEATRVAFTSCLNKGVKDVFLTMWGDDGAECSPFALLSSLSYASDLAYGEENHEKSFLALTGVSREDFETLDDVNELREKNVIRHAGLSKTALFNDLLLGIFDPKSQEGDGKKYAAIAKSVNKAKSASGKLAYVFDTIEKLASVLEIKAELGILTRNAYKEGNKKALKSLLKTHYKPLLTRVDALYKAFKKQWYVENKPFGFEVQDLRFGGLTFRIQTAIDTIGSYVKGKQTAIAELEQERLEPHCDANRHMEIAMTGTISQNVL